MITRFYNYNCLVTYMGELDQEEFAQSLIEALGEAPKYIPRVKEDVNMMEYNGYKLLKIELIYFVKDGILQGDDKEIALKSLSLQIDATIKETLKKQSILFNIEKDNGTEMIK